MSLPRWVLVQEGLKPVVATDVTSRKELISNMDKNKMLPSRSMMKISIPATCSIVRPFLFPHSNQPKDNMLLLLSRKVGSKNRASANCHSNINLKVMHRHKLIER